MTFAPFDLRGPASLWRRAAACLLTAAVVVLGFPGTASAHGGVVLTLHGDGRGSVWVTSVWDDGHPVTEAIGMTLLATSKAGQRVGPAPLKRNGDAMTYAGTLPAGEWTVVADMGTPAIGRCEGTVKVAAEGATSTPDRTECKPPPAAAPQTPTAPVERSMTWVWYVIGAVLLLAVLVWFAFRPRPTPAKGRTSAKQRAKARPRR
jgi:hypothetical protein